MQHKLVATYKQNALKKLHTKSQKKPDETINPYRANVENIVSS